MQTINEVQANQQLNTVSEEGSEDQHHILAGVKETRRLCGGVLQRRATFLRASLDKLMNIDSSDMRLAILSRVCKNINHKYMNGINCIYLNFYRNEA